MPFVREIPGGVQLALKVQPRASANAVAGEHGPELKVRLTAPPVDSAANQALVEFLAERLDCPRNHITLLRGQTSRHKTVAVQGITPAQARARLR